MHILVVINKHLSLLNGHKKEQKNQKYTFSSNSNNFTKKCLLSNEQQKCSTEFLKPTLQRDLNPQPSGLEADAMITVPRRQGFELHFKLK
jgi:hypothetical protein